MSIQTWPFGISPFEPIGSQKGSERAHSAGDQYKPGFLTPNLRIDDGQQRYALLLNRRGTWPRFLAVAVSCLVRVYYTGRALTSEGSSERSKEIISQHRAVKAALMKTNGTKPV